MVRRIAILGKGNVGTALGNGLRRAGYDVRHGHRDPAEPVRDAARWGEVVVLAVPFGEVGNCISAAGLEALADKPLVDVTNALTEEYELAVGLRTSGAEQLQKFVPEAHVVKAFNTAFAETMGTGRVHDKPLTVFVAGDHGGAKRIVLQMARDIGFDAVDAGPLKSARYLEPMALLNIALGHGQQMGTDLGFQLARSGVGAAEPEAEAVPAKR